MADRLDGRLHEACPPQPLGSEALAEEPGRRREVPE